MRRSNRLILFVGIVLAIIAFIGIVLAFQDSTTGGANATPTELPTVYATVDIPLGATVTQDKVEARRVPADQVAQDAIADPGLVVGEIAQTNIAAGKQLRASDFAFDAGQIAVSQNIPKGLRAIAIRVDELSGVGTLINVGDHVDVLAALDQRSFLAPAAARAPTADQIPATVILPDGIDVTSVKVVVQDLLVVGFVRPEAPAAQDGAEETPAPTLAREALVIVAVTPQQAEVIRFAQQQGALTLALRSPQDYVDDAGQPIVPPTQKTSGVVLKNLLEEYGVLVPEIPYTTAGATR